MSRPRIIIKKNKTENKINKNNNRDCIILDKDIQWIKQKKTISMNNLRLKMIIQNRKKNTLLKDEQIRDTCMEIHGSQNKNSLDR